MSLLEIKQYLMQVKIASLATIRSHFNCDSELLRQMLSHWIRKGCVRQCLKTPSCGTKCQQCSPMVTEIYEWVL